MTDERMQRLIQACYDNTQLRDNILTAHRQLLTGRPSAEVTQTVTALFFVELKRLGMSPTNGETAKRWISEVMDGVMLLTTTGSASDD